MTVQDLDKKTKDNEKLQEKLKLFAHLIIDKLLEEQNKGLLKVKE